MDEGRGTAVQVFQDVRRPDGEVDHLVLGEVPTGRHPRLQTFCSHMLLHQIQQRVAFGLDGEDVNQVGNLRMIEVLENATFPLE